VGPEINADKSEYIFTSQECMTNWQFKTANESFENIAKL
jgi:hypothetical protein